MREVKHAHEIFMFHICQKGERNDEKLPNTPYHHITIDHPREGRDKGEEKIKIRK